MDASVIPISNQQLAFSVLLVVTTAAVSAALQLGLLRPLLVGTVRTFLQLTLIGYALAFIFQWNNPWFILLLTGLMTAVATRTATRRVGGTKTPHVVTFLSLFASSLLVSLMVVGLIIRPDPWYDARVAIPIFGMILGNAMNGAALVLQTLFSAVRARAHEVDGLLAFGATPWEAIREPVREAVRAGMTPTINAMMVVGVVSLPGMMTGQILGGVDPRVAVRYQIVVMLMLSAAVALACLLLVLVVYRRMFTADGALAPDWRKSQLAQRG